MLVGHLFCGVLFGALVVLGCLLLEQPYWSVIASLIVGANAGLGASVTSSSPEQHGAGRS